MTSQQTAAALSPKRNRGVLVADDEREIRELLKLRLEQDGFSVWAAADGWEAVEVYRRHGAEIDAVVLDVRMPQLDGPATLVELRALTPDVPCCFMSGYLGGYTVDGLLGLGAHEVLMKPFRLPELTRVVRQLTSTAREAADAGMRNRSP